MQATDKRIMSDETCNHINACLEKCLVIFVQFNQNLNINPSVLEK